MNCTWQCQSVRVYVVRSRVGLVQQGYLDKLQTPEGCICTQQHTPLVLSSPEGAVSQWVNLDVHYARLLILSSLLSSSHLFNLRCI